MEIKLNSKESWYGHHKDIIFGPSNSEHFDGVHLRGTGAGRHFTYRAVQTIKAILPNPEKPRSGAAKAGPKPPHRPRPAGQVRNIRSSQFSHTDCPQARYQRRHQSSHTDCPQAMYQRRHQTRSQGDNIASYAQVVRGGDYGYSYAVPTSNRFTFLD